MLKARTLGHFEIVDLQAMRRCCGLGFVLVVGVVGLGGCSTSAERHQAQTDEESADSTEPSEVLVTLDSGETRWVRREGPLRHRIYPEQLAEVSELFALNGLDVTDVQVLEFAVVTNGFEVGVRQLSNSLPRYAQDFRMTFDRHRRLDDKFHLQRDVVKHPDLATKRPYLSMADAAKLALERLHNDRSRPKADGVDYVAELGFIKMEKGIAFGSASEYGLVWNVHPQNYSGYYDAVIVNATNGDVIYIIRVEATTQRCVNIISRSIVWGGNLVLGR